MKLSRKNYKPSAILLIFLMFIFVLSAFYTPIYAADSTITVNAASVIRTIPDYFYGANCQAWDGYQKGTTDPYNNLMLGTYRNLYRWPGGSWGDVYAWNDMQYGGNTWIVSWDECCTLMNVLGAKPLPICNFSGYWDGVQHTQAEAVQLAANWVTDANITKKMGIKYWEVGNETMGSWEQGNTTGSDYGTRFADFYKAMKAVDPTIKVIAVASQYDVDTGDTWMRDMLTAAKAAGVVPDGFQIHFYQGGTDPSPAANAALLGAGVDNMGIWAQKLNTIVTNYVGASYVGKIEYWATEFRASGVNSFYSRWSMYVGLMYEMQSMLEMAKNGWGGCNAWGEFYYNDWYAYPDWYMYPLVAKKFGRQMVSSTSSNAIIRSYAATDGAGNLTLCIVNNSPDSDLLAQVNLSGFNAGTKGEEWLVQPAGPTQKGDTTPIQERCDLSINGVVHPAIMSVGDMAGTAITTASTFTVAAPKSSIIFIKVPKANTTTDTTPPPAPASLTGSMASAHQANLSWPAVSASDLAGYNVYETIDSSNAATWTKIGTGVTATSFSATRLCDAPTYFFKVTAVDTSGNESAASSVISVSGLTQLFPAPTAHVWAGYPDKVLQSIAIGKPVTTDSEQSWNLAGYGNDGGLTTRWCAADNAIGHWWEVDLGQICNVTGSEIVWEGSGNYYYRIEGSTDNVSWTTLVDKYNYNPTTAQIMDDTFNANVRYVRLTGGGPSGYWTSFWEFAILGSGGNSTPTPTRVTIPTPTVTPTTTIRATNTPTPTSRPTATPTPTRRGAVTATPTPTRRRTVTATPTPTRRGTPSPTAMVTATPTPTRAATPTPTPETGNNMVNYVIQSDWGVGATINVTITNNTATAVNGWTLAWAFPGNQTISNLWNGSYTQSGASVSVKDGGFNANIPANGGSVNFGFNLNYSGTNAKPTSFTLNGMTCRVQ